jgi:hypothetical protein
MYAVWEYNPEAHEQRLRSLLTTMPDTQSHPTSPDESSAGEYRCYNCGAFVTQDFARVFGNNDNEVFGCLDCMDATA